MAFLSDAFFPGNSNRSGSRIQVHIAGHGQNWAIILSSLIGEARWVSYLGSLC